MEDFIFNVVQTEVAHCEFLSFFHNKALLCESVNIHLSKEAFLDELVYTQEHE